jgi:hypothetical protein
MIAGIVKAYNWTLDYVLYELSYVNMIMYSSVLPSYDSNKDKKSNTSQEVIKADDPANRDKINQFLDNVE